MTDTISTPDVKPRYLDTAMAYDLWSEVYDTDGNFLQAFDTIEMKKLLPRMMSLVKGPTPWRFVDLGCGTGRNTVALLGQKDIEITALDLSPKMLEIARNRLGEEAERLGVACTVQLQTFDMLTATSIPCIAQNVNAIVSTLVIEHIPLEVYFATTSEMLQENGILLLTNMHSDMGAISQAGFIDPKTGEKIRPQSYAHTVRHVVETAAKYRLRLLGVLEEKKVTDEIAPTLGPRAKKWIGVTVWFGGLFEKI